MLAKFRKDYDQYLAVKIITVILVVLLSMAVMLPIVLIAELFGVNLRENSGTNLKVDLPNVIFFFLFVASITLVIWLAQKYIHRGKFLDLGFRTKIVKFVVIGFLLGVLQSITGYGIMALTSEKVTYNSVIPDDFSLWAYSAYYIYFIVGLLCNSYIEELVTRAYPIEKLRAHINPHVIFVIMGIIFAAGHFFTRDFTVSHGLTLFIYSYTLSLLYHYSKSIWLVIGMHTGINWIVFSFFGTNWKLGALANIEISGRPEWILNYIQTIIGILFLMGIVYSHKKGLFEKTAS
jgi:membrane protease YdiL (CAAX protease family)